jgi:hypothetical protein
MPEDQFELNWFSDCNCLNSPFSKYKTANGNIKSPYEDLDDQIAKPAAGDKYCYGTNIFPTKPFWRQLDFLDRDEPLIYCS